MAMHHATIYATMENKAWKAKAVIIKHKDAPKRWEVLFSSTAPHALPPKSHRFEELNAALRHAEILLGI